MSEVECFCCDDVAAIPTTPSLITDGREQAVPTICALCAAHLKANRNDLDDGVCSVCAAVDGDRVLRYDGIDIPICAGCVDDILTQSRGAQPADPAAGGETA
ncbi:hypothetical protein NDI54_21020 [Haloarcula sp. S1AR25-5A]|uniref:Uncharacterized protein n=1 Tax=Haloarcula terrestris TaxID=2950533 RepID=A0AAE4F292_9EURY|nr:hypothetical protein [Haloarcula terrestris]MDS0223814.1 hypothetical protein [Haloarcula terrestris]